MADSTERKWTPGPWVATVNHVMGRDRMVAHHKVDSHASGPDKWIGVHIQPAFSVEEHGEANAHLIAAAPCLYEALAQFIDAVERDVIRVRPSERDQLMAILSDANAALAKAEGRS